MARPREFDIDKALYAAMNAFWRKGYAATSMADLMEVMDLQKGSIYKAFGNKHQLFLAALQNYLTSAFFSLKSQLYQAKDPVESLRLYLQRGVNTCKLHPEKGCFALNTLMELGPHDEETSRCLNNHFANVRELVNDIVSKGQEMGLIRRDIPATDVAEYLITMQLGIVSSAKHDGMTDESTVHHSASNAKERVANFTLSQLTVSFN